MAIRLVNSGCGCPPCAASAGYVFLCDEKVLGFSTRAYSLRCLNLSDASEVVGFFGTTDYTKGPAAPYEIKGAYTRLVVSMGKIAYFLPISTEQAVFRVHDIATGTLEIDYTLTTCRPNCIVPYGSGWILFANNDQNNYQILMVYMSGTGILSSTRTVLYGPSDPTKVQSVDAGFIGGDGLLYICGEFTHAQGTSEGSPSARASVCALDPETGIVQPFSPPITSSGNRYTEIWERVDGSVAIANGRTGSGGSAEIAHSSGGSRYSFAAYDKATSALQSWNPGINTSSGDADTGWAFSIGTAASTRRRLVVPLRDREEGSDETEIAWVFNGAFKQYPSSVDLIGPFLVYDSDGEMDQLPLPSGYSDGDPEYREVCAFDFAGGYSYTGLQEGVSVGTRPDSTFYAGLGRNTLAGLHADNDWYNPNDFGGNILNQRIVVVQ